MDLITLADLPELAGTQAKPRTTITIGRLDDNLRDPRYGKFAITQAQVDSWKRNLAETFGGQVSIDFDHSSDRGNGTRAAAWIRSIGQEGKLITADVEFSKRGARAVRNGDYRYTSPTFVENYTDEHGQKHGPALIGAALTNRPVLRKGMPTLSLSKDSFEGIELAKVSAKVRKKTATLRGKGKPEFPMPNAEHARLALQFVGRSLQKGNITPADAAKIRKRANAMLGKTGAAKKTAARDSRAHMADLREVAQLLGLDENADLATVLTGVVTLEAAVPASPSRVPSNPTSSRPTKSGRTDGNGKPESKAERKARKLAKKSASKQTMALSEMDEETFAQLLLDANAGASAATQLAEDRFTAAYTLALSEGRVAPSQEATLRQLHELNPELALKTLASFVPIVPVRPAGSGEGQGQTGPAPMGMDEDRFALHNQAKALAAEKMKADPQLEEGEAYSLAAIEIEDRKFTLENPGQM
jgi:phage I-like protein